MWAQLISARVRTDHEHDLATLVELLQASEQADSGLTRELVMRDQNDPSRVYVLAVFESEEQARARESDPRRDEALDHLRKHMGEMMTGAPEFVDLTVVAELYA